MAKPKSTKLLVEQPEDNPREPQSENQSIEAANAYTEQFTPEICRELTNFIKLIASIHTQPQKSATQSLDKESSEG